MIDSLPSWKWKKLLTEHRRDFWTSASASATKHHKHFTWLKIFFKTGDTKPHFRYDVVVRLTPKDDVNQYPTRTMLACCTYCRTRTSVFPMSQCACRPPSMQVECSTAMDVDPWTLPATAYLRSRTLPLPCPSAESQIHPFALHFQGIQSTSRYVDAHMYPAKHQCSVRQVFKLSFAESLGSSPGNLVQGGLARPEGSSLVDTY